MNSFITQRYSGRAYTAEESISFSNSPNTHFADIKKEMQYHSGVKHIQVSCLTQKEFDTFVGTYADNYESIYFFQNTQIKDLSALSALRNVKYLLFYNLHAARHLWNMKNNISLKGLYINESKNLIYDIAPIAEAPSLEELLIFSNLNRKYTIQTLEPLKGHPTLRRVMLDCKTENGDFNPSEFSHLEYFQYRVDQHKNYRY